MIERYEFRADIPGGIYIYAYRFRYRLRSDRDRQYEKETRGCLWHIMSIERCGWKRKWEMQETKKCRHQEGGREWKQATRNHMDVTETEKRWRRDSVRAAKVQKGSAGGVTALEQQSSEIYGKCCETFPHIGAKALLAGPELPAKFQPNPSCLQRDRGFSLMSFCRVVRDNVPKVIWSGGTSQLLSLSGPDPLRFLRVALRIEISTRCVFCVAGRIFIGFCLYQT